MSHALDERGAVEGMRAFLDDVEPGTDVDGHVEAPSVEEMVDPINEVTETAARSGKYVQWFDIVEGGIANAQPRDLVVIAERDRRDGVPSNGHIGILPDLVYDSEAGRIERIRVARKEPGAE